ncbi:hypothetical protein [Anaerosphaera multitolerans]|uniref:Uncharacterized protein n=1 Tax=Anaerosphaera multitolerans TaxID=2487351 RepID=A0A437S4V6_9FIRM|nr:hypothetical protein [Anaerosphaera multitolerans]RVU54049.1 hypothetical protein EF514_09270 [Anaerosphaera multitolerans]
MENQRKYLREVCLNLTFKNLGILTLMIGIMALLVEDLSLFRVLLIIYISVWSFYIQGSIFERAIKSGVTRVYFVKYRLFVIFIMAIIYSIIIPVTFTRDGMNGPMYYTLPVLLEIFTYLVLLMTFSDVVVLIYEKNKFMSILIALLFIIYIYYFDRGLIEIFKARGTVRLMNKISGAKDYNLIVNYSFYFKMFIRCILSALLIVVSWKYNLKRDVK